jgi:hypothetical protein
MLVIRFSSIGGNLLIYSHFISQAPTVCMLCSYDMFIISHKIKKFINTKEKKQINEKKLAGTDVRTCERFLRHKQMGLCGVEWLKV